MLPKCADRRRIAQCDTETRSETFLGMPMALINCGVSAQRRKETRSESRSQDACRPGGLKRCASHRRRWEQRVTTQPGFIESRGQIGSQLRYEVLEALAEDVFVKQVRGPHASRPFEPICERAG